MTAPPPNYSQAKLVPLLPELITEGDTIAEALVNVGDALAAIIEAYQDLSLPSPSRIVG